MIDTGDVCVEFFDELSKPSPKRRLLLIKNVIPAEAGTGEFETCDDYRFVFIARQRVTQLQNKAICEMPIGGSKLLFPQIPLRSFGGYLLVWRL